MPSFAGIQEDCEQIINDIRQKLELRLQVLLKATLSWSSEAVMLKSYFCCKNW